MNRRVTGALPDVNYTTLEFQSPPDDANNTPGG